MDWCAERDSNPLFTNLTSVLDYLTHLFTSGYATASLNTLRSMLSMTLDPINGHNIGEHPLVIQLLKGCYNLNPPKPRYEFFWDPDLVLNYFISLGANSNLGFYTLSKKLAILLALSTISRTSEICSISLPSISFSDKAVKFSFSRLKKAQTSGPLKTCVFSRLKGLCCPVECLETYLTTAKHFRLPNNSSLFLSIKRPHRPIRSSTLGHWLKSCLEDAGLTKNSYSTHSTRGAAASKAILKGVPIEFYSRLTGPLNLLLRSFTIVI